MARRSANNEQHPPVATPTLNNKSKSDTIKAFAEIGASVEAGDYAATVSNVKRFAPRSTRVGIEFTIRGGKFDGEKVTLLTKEKRTKSSDIPGVNDDSVESQVTAILGRKLDQWEREGDFDLEDLIGEECYVGVMSIHSRKDGAVWIIKSKATARVAMEGATQQPKTAVATVQPKREVAPYQRPKCPKCKCENIKKLSLVYEEGFSDISTTTRSSGVAVGLTAGGVGVGVGSSVGHSRGDQQTLLSKRATPPPIVEPKLPTSPQSPSKPLTPGEEGFGFGICGALFISPFLYLFDVTSSYWLTAFGFLAVGLLWGVVRAGKPPRAEDVAQYDKKLLAYKAVMREYNIKVNAIKLEHNRKDPYCIWSRTYMCLQCGETFVPS